MSLGTIIRQRRKKLGLTQDQLAAMTGVSKPYLSNIETDKCKNPPSDNVLRQIERRLRFALGELTRIAHILRTPVDVQHDHERMAAELQKLRAIVKDLISARAPRKSPGGIDLNELAARLSERGSLAEFSAGAVVPVVNKAAAGYPHHFTDLDYPASVAEEYIRCPDLHDPKAFAVRVVGDSMEPRYREGDVVVFSPAVTPRAGDDCFIRFADGSQTTFKRYYRDGKNAVRLQPLNDRYPADTHSASQISGLWPAVYRFERLRGK